MRSLISLAVALLCLAATAGAAAEELGRLFFTPEQRRDLDSRRATNRAEQEAPQAKEGPITIQGQVLRSSGRTVTWINGAPEYDDSRAGQDAARATVVPNAGEPGVRLKVGETYERTSGEIHDVLNGGKITVRNFPANTPSAARNNGASKSSAPVH